ncbi:hypothetical protein Tco_0717210 [Tanacetum coccineum]
MTALGSSRYSSNDMVHNHYLEEAKKQTHEIGKKSKISMMPSARSQSTSNDCNPKPRSRNWPTSKSSCVTKKTMPIADHYRNSSNFSDSKHFVCSTCQKCVFNANHVACVTKFLNEVNSRAKVETDGKIFESSTTKVDSEPLHGSNTDITNLQECIQTLDSSAEYPSDTNVFTMKMEILLEPTSNKLLTLRLYGGDDIPFQLKSDSLPNAHAQTKKTYYKHQDSRIKKAQDSKTKTFANSDIKDNSSETKLQGRLLDSFQEGVKYEHVGQDTRSQGRKDDQN